MIAFLLILSTAFGVIAVISADRDRRCHNIPGAAHWRATALICGAVAVLCVLHYIS